MVVRVRWNVLIFAQGNLSFSAPGGVIGTTADIRGWDDNNTRNCTSTLSYFNRRVMGFRVATISNRTTYSEGPFDCPFEAGDTIEVRSGNFLIFSISRATYRLKAGQQHQRSFLGFGLGLGYFHFVLVVK